MSYAEVPDVRARAGRLASAWTDGSAIADPELDRFIDDAAASIDALLSQWTVATPVTGAAGGALRSLNAKMAAVDALQATFPADTGPNEAKALIDRLSTEVYGKDGNGGEWGKLVAGKHPAVVVLVQTGAVPAASSFWTNEPDYGQIIDPADLMRVNRQMLPRFSRLSQF